MDGFIDILAIGLKEDQMLIKYELNGGKVWPIGLKED